MEKYVTVVSVDEQPPAGQPAIEESPPRDASADSQFVTVLSINHSGGVAPPEGGEELEPELVLVYRLPGERLGFGLKFQGGTKNNEKIQRLFIQSCAENSPASRVQASWGFLREGDEILEIDGVSVTRMTRIECVKCLKESNLAIKLLVRNGEGKVQNFYDENGDVPERKSGPPPPPPVPPRKLNKRKIVEKVAEEATPAKQIVEVVHPPDAEVYSNLFSDDISDLISESDDTASTISTVIDKYSICSSLSSEDYTISAVPTSLELAKALKPFTLLEKEFNLDNKLENALFPFPPTTVNVVQLEVEAEPNEYENVTIAKVDENRNYENVIVQASDHQPANYENVTIQAVVPEPTAQPYENIVISQDTNQPESSVYENVDLKEPPRPLPRQVEPKKRTSVMAPPRQKAPAPPIPKTQPTHPHEFNTIQSWLQEATEVIHECALADPPKEPTVDNRPRLIDFHPKVTTPAKTTTTTIAVDPEPEPPKETNNSPEVVVKKCIKIVATNGSSSSHNYIESSSSSEEDEDEERSYEPRTPDEFEDSLGGGDDDSGAFDAYSDEDGEKLGPPEIVAGGPSEAYFNFHWTTTLLPPIGEVEIEEEFSSLENAQQQSGPIVIIDTAEETLINDNNNNQHREPKPKLNGHHHYERPASPSEYPAEPIVNQEEDIPEAIPEQREPIEVGDQATQSDVPATISSNDSDEGVPAVTDKHDDDDAIVPNNEQIVLPEDGTAASQVVEEVAADQLTNELVGDNDVPEMDGVDSGSEVTAAVKVEQDDAVVDELLAVVVGDSVDSDFEELVKAQLDEDGSGAEQQIQQIHERIIVGIEGSSGSEEEDKPSEAEEVVQVQEVVSEVTEEVLGSEEVEPPSVDVPDCKVDSKVTPETMASADNDYEDVQVESNQESANSSQAAAAAVTSATSTNGSSSTDDVDLTKINAAAEVGTTDLATNTTTTSATSMDQMNNVVTTTTTVTAIASTVHQPTSTTTKIVSYGHQIQQHSQKALLPPVPPAFSRLPPDGHEFPPNFSEPAANGMISTVAAVINGGTPKGDKHSSYDDIPDLPKTHPPPVPRKVFRQDLVLKQLDTNGNSNSTTEPTFKKPPIFPARSNSLVPESNGKSAASAIEDRRRSFDIHEINKPPSRVTLVGSNWRKDEKSERSVRDKIAMFSNGSGGGGGGGGSEGGGGGPEGSPILRKFSKDFTKSSENLLGSDGGYPKKSSVDPIETYATLRKKAHSVENLDEVDHSGVQNGSHLHGGKFGLESSKPVVLGKAFSVENLNPSNGSKVNGEGKMSDGGLFGNVKNLARTTSFSGYSNGTSLATITNTEERRKSSITSLLEQRKKSMSKLRGLVIPEKVPETEVLPETKIIGLPIIKSKDSEKILSSSASPNVLKSDYARKTATLPTPGKSANGSSFHPTVAPKPSELGGTYKSIFRNLKAEKAEEDQAAFRRPLNPVPPAKPPRTSLVYPPPKGLDQRSMTTEDESGDDSDSVLSSRVSSPPVSPVAPSPPEKYVLTRTLSSETNTSITSSNSTLTSSSGSQASCSSVGSTPAIDMSRRISKSSSNEMSMNRKNVLASAKSRSGRGDLKIEDAGKIKRYEDGDSTDGYEEEERRKSKSKPRNSLTNGKSANGFEEKELTHYKVVDSVDSIVDKVIKVASYVEVVSDVEENASVDTEVIVPMQKPATAVEPPIVKEKINSVAIANQNNSNTMSDLAKWVRHEAAKVEQPAGVRAELKKYTRSVSDQVVSKSEEIAPTKRELRSSVDSKKLNLAEIRKNFEAKSNNSTVVPSPVKITPKEPPVTPLPKSTPVPVAPTTTNNHDRFSSWDSLASSSSGVSSLQTNSLLGNTTGTGGSSQTLQSSTPSDYGSFSSLGSSHSLITPQDLQLIIEEADPPLATPEAFVIVLQRETPESSIGITLAGGSDYEAKEITIHKILSNSPAEKDGRLRRGDRILSINGLSMRGLTHRESLSVLKTPRPEVVMVITRSKSLTIDTGAVALLQLAKTKRPSLGSLSSLAEKNEMMADYGGGAQERSKMMKIQHKASRSLDLDLDIVSNEAESVFDGTASEDGLLSADESKCSSITPASDDRVSASPQLAAAGVAVIVGGSRMVEILKDGAGLGFSIEGGFDSPAGNKPLMIKKIFMGGAAEKSGLLRAGEEIVAINDISIERMTRIQVWNMMKKLPNGSVRIALK